MARQARQESGALLYHVMMRGNNREYIFKRYEQKSRFLEALKAEGAEGRIMIAAWCLMDNHVHLVLKGELEELIQALKRINIKYAMGFNNQEKRIGHVFQDRYRSQTIESDNQLLAVIRYVHNNPVKAKMVANAEDYTWSSYLEYTQDYSFISMELRQKVLDYFTGDIAQFESFHLQQDDQEYLEIKEDAETYRLDRSQGIIETFCKANGIREASELYQNPTGLDQLIFNLVKTSGLSLRKIAALLGVSYSRVHQISLRANG